MNTVTFEQLDRAARIREMVENSKNFYQWVQETGKTPENFCDWGEIISEYHLQNGSEWIQPIPIKSPFGFMGYEVFEPPQKKTVEIQPIGFYIEPNEVDNDFLFLFDFSDDSDDE